MYVFPMDMVFLRNICINTLQKGAKNDDDDDHNKEKTCDKRHP
jgi:hypothetical protein